MADSAPWYARLLTTHDLLIVAGVVLLLCSLGDLSIGEFVFRPTREAPQLARILLAMTAILLITTGVTLHLYRADVWRTRLAVAHFAGSLVLMSIAAVAVGRGPIPTATKAEVFQRWEATSSGCEATLRTAPELTPLSETHKLLLVCRKNDPSVPFERDTRIQKSMLFTIDGGDVIQHVAVSFDHEFAGRLDAGDKIEFALVVLPNNRSRDDVDSLNAATNLGGIIRATVWNNITDTTTSAKN